MATAPKKTFDQMLEERARVDSAPAWKPTEKGEMIIGVFTGESVYEHEEYGPSPVYSLDTADGPQRVFALHGVLVSRWEEAAPTVGETVGIAYNGRVPSNKRKNSDGSPTMVHTYTVMVDRPE